MKISFLASHGGSVAKYIISAMSDGRLSAQIGIVITNNLNSDIYKWCLDNKILVAHISGKTHPTKELEDKAIQEAMLEAGTDLIILSGYMKKISNGLLTIYPNKILNTHPSLLPKYGGAGMYGDKIHTAVLASKDTQSGATIHFINQEYDDGAIIAQQSITIDTNENIETLRNKVKATENKLFLKSLQGIIS